MTVTLNGEPRQFPDQMTLRQMLQDLGFERSAVAVAINGEFVPRSEHETHQLQAGDRIECVAPMQGG